MSAIPGGKGFYRMFTNFGVPDYIYEDALETGAIFLTSYEMNLYASLKSKVRKLIMIYIYSN